MRNAARALRCGFHQAFGAKCEPQANSRLATWSGEWASGPQYRLPGLRTSAHAWVLSFEQDPDGPLHPSVHPSGSKTSL